MMFLAKYGWITWLSWLWLCLVMMFRILNASKWLLALQLECPWSCSLADLVVLVTCVFSFLLTLTRVVYVCCWGCWGCLSWWGHLFYFVVVGFVFIRLLLLLLVPYCCLWAAGPRGLLPKGNVASTVFAMQVTSFPEHIMWCYGTFKNVERLDGVGEEHCTSPWSVWPSLSFSTFPLAAWYCSSCCFPDAVLRIQPSRPKRSKEGKSQVAECRRSGCRKPRSTARKQKKHSECRGHRTKRPEGRV